MKTREQYIDDIAVFINTFEEQDVEAFDEEFFRIVDGIKTHIEPRHQDCCIMDLYGAVDDAHTSRHVLHYYRHVALFDTNDPDAVREHAEDVAWQERKHTLMLERVGQLIHRFLGVVMT